MSEDARVDGFVKSLKNGGLHCEPFGRLRINSAKPFGLE